VRQRGATVAHAWRAVKRWLAGYRHPRCYRREIAERLCEVFAEQGPLFAGADAVGGRVGVLPVLFHLMWRQVLVADLDNALLGRGRWWGWRWEVGMGRSRPAVLRVADRVRFAGRVQTVVGLEGTLVRLADEAGAVSVTHLPHLLVSAGFEVLSGGGSVPLGSAVSLTGLAQAVVDKASWWERHLVEVLSGLPPGAEPGECPRAGYDPAVFCLAQREQTKAAELAALGVKGASARTVRRKRQRYQARGISGLIDGRADRVEPPLARADARVVDALRAAVGEAVAGSSRTGQYLRWRTGQILAERHGGEVAMPSRSAFYRLLAVVAAGRHTTGSARTRRSLANRPSGVFGQVTAARPGELMQIDSTPLDVAVRLADGVVGRVELTGMVDLATRSVTAAVLRPTTKAVDASLLLARACTPEPMRPGWPDALAMSRSVLPWRHLLEVDQRLAHAAAMPVIVPETIVCDRGMAFLSRTFRASCQALGISLQPAHPRTPTDKPHIERTLESVSTLFCQFVAGYLGRSVDTRGADATSGPLWSMPELQELLDEWLVAVWQNRPHDGLRDPAAPGRAFTPNQKYAALVAAAGYVPVALSGEDYIELLPATWRAINAYGIKISRRVYDCEQLDGLRQQPSGITAKQNLWEVHHDPYDVTRIWVRDHHATGWITVPWRHLATVPVPFGELAWDHARRSLPDGTERKSPRRSPACSPAPTRDPNRPPPRWPARTAGSRPRTRAGTPAIPPPTPQTGPGPDPGDDEPIPLAAVIPLGVFDAHEEAKKRW
jgi:putative transposase